MDTLELARLAQSLRRHLPFVNGETSLKFDLSELQEWEGLRNGSRLRLRAWSGVGLGCLVLVIGVYAEVARFPTTGPIVLIVAGGALIATGVAVAAGSWWYAISIYERAPNELLVSDAALSLSRSATAGFVVRFGWDDSRLRVVLQDRSELRARLGERDSYSEYRLVPPAGASLPIPKPAFDQIILIARKHGAEIKQQHIGLVAITIIRGRGSRTGLQVGL